MYERSIYMHAELAIGKKFNQSFPLQYGGKNKLNRELMQRKKRTWHGAVYFYVNYVLYKSALKVQ